MHEANIRLEAFNLLDAFVMGKASRKTVWRWAESIIYSDNWDKLPQYLQESIHGMWLLHDDQGNWVPDATELGRIRAALSCP